MIHELLGWVGAFLFAVCAVPQVIRTWRTKSASDLSWLFLLFWFFGEILTLVYILIDDHIEGIAHFPLYINYVFNAVLVLYLIYARAFYPRRSVNDDI